MKICPRCQKTYADDNLNFCLEDGVVLTQAPAAAPQTYQIPPAAATGQPQGSTPQSWNTPQQAYAPQRKSSKTWIWVLLILGAVALLCGGGFIGLLAFIGSQADNNGNSTSNNSSKGLTNTSTSNGDPTNRKDVESISFSKWVPSVKIYADVEFTDGELLVKNKEKRYYYVLAGSKEQISVGADTTLTVRNVDNGDTDLGYGLVFHSDPKPLQQGYAFLIDAKKKRYRVVHHTPSDEDAVIDWTRSDAILPGSVANTLEVRDRTDKIELYINGKLVNSIKNTFGYPNGVVGVYSSSALRIAFKDLQIKH